MPRHHHAAPQPDPFRQFTLRVKWDGVTIPGISFVSALSRSVEVTEFREGGNTGAVHLLPGRTIWSPLTVRRPVSSDRAFEQWANLLSAEGTGLASFRKDVRIELHAGKGPAVIAYDVHRCWVRGYEALPVLDLDNRRILVETLTLHHDGWARVTTMP